MINTEPFLIAVLIAHNVMCKVSCVDLAIKLTNKSQIEYSSGIFANKLNLAINFTPCCK